jgi:hypothetical protein
MNSAQKKHRAEKARLQELCDGHGMNKTQAWRHIDAEKAAGRELPVEPAKPQPVAPRPIRNSTDAWAVRVPLLKRE